MSKTTSRTRSANAGRESSLELHADVLTAAAAASAKQARQARRFAARLQSIEGSYERDIARILDADRRAAFDRIFANYARSRARAYRDGSDNADLRRRVERAWARASRALQRLVDDRGIDERAVARLHAQRVSRTAKAFDAYDALPPPVSGEAG